MKKRIQNLPRKYFIVSALLLALLGLVLYATSRDDRSPQERASQPSGRVLPTQPAKEIPYSEMIARLESGRVQKITLNDTGRALLLGRDGRAEFAFFPPSSIQDLADRASANTEVVVQKPSGGGSGEVLRTLLPLLLFAALILFFIIYSSRKYSSQNQHPTHNAGNMSESNEKISFADVAGVDEAVAELREWVEFMHQPEKFHALGARIPSGAILYGPPGTGKTLLARALAGEAGVPFYYMAGSEAVHKYVGVGADNIRSIFARARSSEGGAVIFIDEIDALGRSRGDESNREHDQTLNQLLVELDGFSRDDSVVVLAATNRLDTLDQALLRPGRLSRQIAIMPPDREGRRAILDLYCRDKPLDADVDLDGLAATSAGMSGADLAEMVNEAAIVAARRAASRISLADFREGHLRSLLGPSRESAGRSKEEERRIAYHEAGHVLCAEVSPLHESAQQVSIISRGLTGGAALYGQEDRGLYSLEYVRDKIMCILGGRAAERVVFSTVSSGAANDLQQANELARRAIEDWGLVERTGQLLSRSGHAVSEQTRSRVDEEVEALVAEEFRRAVFLLEENRALLQSLAQSLLEQKSLERIDIVSALAGKLKPALPRAKNSGPGLDPALRKQETPRKIRRVKESALLWLQTHRRSRRNQVFRSPS